MAVASVDVTGVPVENVVLVGGTAQLTAVPRDAGGAALERRTTWATTDAAVAQVSSSGLVTALSPGIAVITARSGDVSGAAAIDVRVSVPVPPATAGAPVTTSVLGNTLQLTLAPGAAATPSLTVGRALVVTNDTRILTGTAFAIGPANVTFSVPASIELQVGLTGIPTAKRSALRLFRVSNDGGIEAVPSSSVDIARGVVLATLARGGTYVVIVPGDPALLTATEGVSRRVAVGTAVPGIAVQARDAAGNPVFGASVEFSVEGTNGSIVGERIAVTDIEGIATLPGAWIAGPSQGAYALRARVVGAPLAVLFQATAYEPAVAVAIRSAPTSGRSGVGLGDPVIVELVDAFDQRAEVTQEVTLALIGGSGTLNGTTVSTAVLGGAIFQGQRIDGPGTYRIVASSPGLAPDTTAEIVVTQELARLRMLTRPSGAVSGLPFTTQPVVELLDHAGVRVAGGDAVVTATLLGSGTLFGTRSVAAVDGVATFTNLGIDGSGEKELSFSNALALQNESSGPFAVAPAPPGIRLLVGGTPLRDASPGQVFGVPVALDLSNRGSDDLATVDVTITWDPARFAYFGNVASSWLDSANVASVLTADISQVAAGRIRFTGTSANATLTSFWAGLLQLETLPTTSVVESVIGAVVHTAASAAAAPVTVRVVPMTVTVFPQP